MGAGTGMGLALARAATRMLAAALRVDPVVALRQE